MTPGKTLSVVVPNFNDSEYLGVQLRAICQQSFQPFEVIVVDDCSTDQSVAIIEKLACEFPFIRLIRNERNFGVVYSCNRGAQIASGDYIYVCSANDLAYPEFFEKSMRLLSRYPQAAFCCADVRIIDEVQGVTFDHLSTNWLAEPGFLSPAHLAEITRMRTGLYAPVANTCIVRRDLLCDSALYLPELACFSDWFFYQVNAFRFGVCFIPERLAAVRVLKNSYGLSVLDNHALCRKVLSKVLELLCSPEYKDVTALMIRGRSLLVFRTFIRSPLTVWLAVRPLLLSNRKARQLMMHLTGEYARQVVVRLLRTISFSRAMVRKEPLLAE